jgi:ABC-type sugar transport system permease subunit
MKINRNLLTRDERRAIPFVLPGVLVSALLIIYPLIYIVSMSLTNSKAGEKSFAGLNNYISLFKNPQFNQAMVNTVIWTLATVFLSFIIGLVLALIINSYTVKFKGFWRSIIFIPWVIPGVVKATAWKWLFSNEGGMVNHILESLGIISKPIPWLIDPDFAIWSIIIVQVWACAPYVMLLMTAGLQQLPKDVLESADIDGANGLQKLFIITLPMLRDIVFICILMLLIWAINEFSLIWIMTNGGPAGSTTTLSLLIYNQFKVLNLNSASASAVIQLLISMFFAIAYVKLIDKGD